MKDSGIRYRNEGPGYVGVYRANRRIGSIYHGTDKKWWYSDVQGRDIRPASFTIDEIRDILGLMSSLAGTDIYGHKREPDG